MAVSALARLFAKLAKRFGRGEAQRMMRSLGYSEQELMRLEKAVPKAGRTLKPTKTFPKRKAARIAKPTTEAARKSYEARQKAEALRKSNIARSPYTGKRLPPQLGIEGTIAGRIPGAGPASRAELMSKALARPQRTAGRMAAKTPSRLIPPTRGDNYRKEFEKKALEGMRGYSAMTVPGQLAKPNIRPIEFRRFSWSPK